VDRANHRLNAMQNSTFLWTDTGTKKWSGFPEQQSSIFKWIGCGLKVIEGSSAARKRLRARSIGDPILFMLPLMSW
jgi:hypothetical protein